MTVAYAVVYSFYGGAHCSFIFHIFIFYLVLWCWEEALKNAETAFITEREKRVRVSENGERVIEIQIVDQRAFNFSIEFCVRATGTLMAPLNEVVYSRHKFHFIQTLPSKSLLTHGETEFCQD